MDHFTRLAATPSRIQVEVVSISWEGCYNSHLGYGRIQGSSLSERPHCIGDLHSLGRRRTHLLGTQDRTVKVWRAEDGILCGNLTGHAHWINTLAINTDYALRTSCFDPKNGCEQPANDEEAAATATRRYADALRTAGGVERLVSGSDDYTMFLWTPAAAKTCTAKMVGHQQQVNQVAWSADSLLIVSGSADSTLKVWELETRRLRFDLPGHGDEVFTVDWSPEGTKVVSGGKDKLLRLWKQ